MPRVSGSIPSRVASDRTPTDEEILKYRNVPVEVAAKYIGWSSSTLKNAMKHGTAPVGMVAQNENGGFSYHISPGNLVKYMNGELPIYRLNEVIKLITDSAEEVMNTRVDNLQKLLELIQRV